MNEATARIKINTLLSAAGWRFFPEGNSPANICLEYNVSPLNPGKLDALGENFEKTPAGFIDFLLLDDRGFPLIVLEAKSENKNPLSAKEQARAYARSQNCRFVILSNGNLHYFWDLDRGNPHIITKFPSPKSVIGYKKVAPDPARLISENVDDDYIVLTQRPGYQSEAAWLNPAERPHFIDANKLRFLRPYQQSAIHALQAAVRDGKDRFLFEMATGTGKTLIAAAIVKLFLRTGNASRVLFLVDRIELEDQALKAFKAVLANDFKTVIFKEHRTDWRHAEIVVSTVQSFLFNNKYLDLFSPTDFDLVISDEAHRSIGGNARSVFDYFVGYKLGLTATPKDYLRRFDSAAPSNDPREHERRLLLDTYRTFGCENSQPTFRYSLLDGVKDGYLINPTVVDARTDITTALLSEQGFVVDFKDEQGDDQTAAFTQTQFERRFIAESTNHLFCKTFLEHAYRDPISGEIGKSIIFAVSQVHAAKLAQILNLMADKMYPGKYQSDFAVQITSQIHDAQQLTINFTNNKLLGSANFIETYKTSKARVCVTVGMMTTGYDCPDLLNLGLFRPIFSPTEFIQIKGRGTRKHNFSEELFDPELKSTYQNLQKIEGVEGLQPGVKGYGLQPGVEGYGLQSGVEGYGLQPGVEGYGLQPVHQPSEINAALAAEGNPRPQAGLGRQSEKTAYKLFDFFATCQYFEEDFNYDEVIDLPRPAGPPREQDSHGPTSIPGKHQHFGQDILATIKEQPIGLEGMRIDRMFFEKFKDSVKNDDFIKASVEAGQWDRVIDYVNREVFDRPEEFYTLDKLRKAAAVDRRIGLREILEKVFDLIPRFKSKDELLEEEFAKFVADLKPDQPEIVPALKHYFKAYVTSNQVRDIIEQRQFTDLATNPIFSARDFKEVPEKYRTLIPEYVKDYVSFNQFAA